MSGEWNGQLYAQPEEPQAQFCHMCGAGIGAFRRAGEGTCPVCDTLKFPNRPTGPNKVAVFAGALCKGSYALGTACGTCDRCRHVRYLETHAAT